LNNDFWGNLKRHFVNSLSYCLLLCIFFCEYQINEGGKGQAWSGEDSKRHFPIIFTASLGVGGENIHFHH